MFSYSADERNFPKTLWCVEQSKKGQNVQSKMIFLVSLQYKTIIDVGLSSFYERYSRRQESGWDACRLPTEQLGMMGPTKIIMIELLTLLIPSDRIG